MKLLYKRLVQMFLIIFLITTIYYPLQCKCVIENLQSIELKGQDINLDNLTTPEPLPFSKENEGNCIKPNSLYERSSSQTPKILIDERTISSLSVSATFPQQNVWGNRIQLWNSITGEWSWIQPDFYLNDGTYTFTGLTRDTTYLVRLSWYDGIWHDIDIYTIPQSEYKSEYFTWLVWDDVPRWVGADCVSNFIQYTVICYGEYIDFHESYLFACADPTSSFDDYSVFGGYSVEYYKGSTRIGSTTLSTSNDDCLVSPDWVWFYKEGNAKPLIKEEYGIYYAKTNSAFSVDGSIETKTLNNSVSFSVN